MKLVKRLGFLAIAIAIQGCTTTSHPNAVTDQIIISEPSRINYKSELELARMTEILNRAEITEPQRAQLLYHRGVLYDSVGLRALARFDFTRALKLQPDMVDAYNFIGIHFTQLQEFTQAYEAFDSAIELEPEHEYAYLNRGIALYYGGRPNLAAQDLAQFYQAKTNDPYRALWLFIAERQVNEQQAIASLKERAEQISDAVWAKEIIKLYTGEYSQQKVIARLADSIANDRQLTERLCEAYFYLGKFNQFNGDIDVAKNFYKLALGTNVYKFVEHRYAQLELDILASTHNDLSFQFN